MGTPGRAALAAMLACLAVGTVAPAHATALAANPDSVAPSVRYVACPDGSTSVVTTTANGFNPLTATKAQLLANNLPPRPTNSLSGSLSVWQRFVTTYRPAADCTPAIVDPTRHLESAHGAPQPLSATAGVSHTGAAPPNTDVHAPNWAGNVAIDTYWNDAYGQFQIQVPQAPMGSCAYSAQWVGIGLGNNSTYPLVQSGSWDSACYNRSEQTVYLWWEEVWRGGGNSTQSVYTGAHPGDYIWVHINVPNNCGRPTMTIEDLTTGWVGSYGGPWTACSDGTAEWILERPDRGGTFPLLANAAVVFQGADVSGPGVEAASLGSVPHYWYTMWDCPNYGPNYRLAYPGPITSDGEQYENYWQNYGFPSPDDCKVA